MLKIVRNQFGLFNGHSAPNEVSGVAGDLLQTFKETPNGIAEVGIARQENILNLGCRRRKGRARLRISRCASRFVQQKFVKSTPDGANAHAHSAALAVLQNTGFGGAKLLKLRTATLIAIRIDVCDILAGDR